MAEKALFMGGLSTLSMLTALFGGSVLRRQYYYKRLFKLEAHIDGEYVLLSA